MPRTRLGSHITTAGDEPEINMAPMIDMIFILLIFFLVTASFVRASGVEIDQPAAATAKVREEAGLVVGVAPDGGIYIEGRQVDLKSVRGLVEIFLVETPEGGIIISADRRTVTGRLVEVLDQCRLAGAEKVAVSAKRIE
ncbi:MAG: biopolymer transporter ExbD [Pseudomonadota bacterium]